MVIFGQADSSGQAYSSGQEDSSFTASIAKSGQEDDDGKLGNPEKSQLNLLSLASAHPQQWCSGWGFLPSPNAPLHNPPSRAQLQTLAPGLTSQARPPGDPRLCRSLRQWLVSRDGLWLSVSSGLRLWLREGGL